MLLGDIFSAFRQGKELTNAATWKNRTVAASTVAGLLASLVAIAGAFGYRVDVDQDTLQAVGAGVTAFISLASAVMHVVTSSRVGLPDTAGNGGSGINDSGGN